MSCWKGRRSDSSKLSGSMERRPFRGGTRDGGWSATHPSGSPARGEDGGVGGADSLARASVCSLAGMKGGTCSSDLKMEGGGIET